MQRYELEGSFTGAKMEADNEGEWVRFEDVEKGILALRKKAEADVDANVLRLESELSEAVTHAKYLEGALEECAKDFIDVFDEQRAIKKRDDMLAALKWAPLTFDDFTERGSPDWERFRKTVRPGAVIRTSDGNIYIIGDTNDLGGELGICCAGWHAGRIAEIAYLWEQEPTGDDWP